MLDMAAQSSKAAPTPASEKPMDEVMKDVQTIFAVLK
jgi:hypothetical protein